MKTKRQPGRGSFARCVDQVGRRGGVDDPRAVCAAAKRKAGERLNRRRKNSPDEAAEAYEAFHGFPAKYDFVYTEQLHFHSNLFGIGKLIRLEIVPEGESRPVILHAFEGTLLAGNEAIVYRLKRKRHQLFFVGGQQSVPLAEFAIEDEREMEVLGKATAIVYHTNKTHLGEEGGKADYHHEFGEEAGKEKRVKILAAPTVLYDTVNQKLALAGGRYAIEEEGIRN